MSLFDKVRRQKYLSFTVLLFTLSIGVLIGTVVNTGVKAAKEQAGAPGATPLTVPSPVQLQNSFATLAKMLEPSVVNISTEYIPSKTTSKAQPHSRRNAPQEEEGDQQDGMQELMRRFFGGNGGSPFGGEGGESPDQRSASLGSGVVVDRNGYILTNNHVVEHATRMKVKFTNDDTEYTAKLIGTDPITDLAVIKIDKTNLTPAKIGNSDAIQVGDWAVAIGSPFGFQATVTAGIISAKQRNLDDGPNSSFQHFLQTDAAINPGNSGGPLLNINGEVVGINTMIASRSGGYQGIGFAMPINTAVKIYNEIIKTGHITRGSIGVQFYPDTNPDTKDRLKAYGATNGGVFVSQVPPGPAEKAGIKAEDIITSVDGHTIRNGQDLIDAISNTPVGTAVKIGLLRDGKTQTVSVVVGDRNKVFDNTATDKTTDTPDGAEAAQAKFGISIQNVTGAQRQNLGYKGTGGVVVASVEPGSFADDIGIAKGDIIESMTSHSQKYPISSVEDVKKIQGQLKPGDTVAFRVMRGPGVRGGGGGNWQPLYLAGTLPAQ